MINFAKKPSAEGAITAVQKYLNLNESNNERHEAFIIASVNGRDQHGVRTVSAQIVGETAIVIIEDLHTLCQHETNMFTSQKDDIYFVGNKTLQIKPKASLCGRIVIEITPKN